MFERLGRRAYQMSCELLIALAAMWCTTAAAQNANKSDTSNLSSRITRVNVCVTAEGVVESAKVVRSSGNKHIDEGALKMAYGGKFHPATRKGEAVPACMDMDVRFVLKDEESAEAPTTEKIMQDAVK
ncbi:energy transducer TonB [Peristeroidobacter agariperforans]|uniref:energy transducer TonB n=1 Tax=Peristeroidobacter agariperforans TaxID=268404 RepID=UPI00101DED99|nr:energy transducer TonB [Peristeroidobacter agariperforans]